ncbi:type I addiction module toxin, SymE family|uniref:Toxic protein SymE n=1 Tax=Dendrosporobacter quercicolus TaxID=146817 RepID=A0A1H0AJ51_9FIRM|nr:SymE family type I addiction module toxin [Dendrosporobacter quercicolus]NSL49642.1 type I addiction module toxin, SymE family [Dendrosporobacter quercicolus DSM 1736]SDN33608.1 toxic protein SymE [Dendrosporobacter quercicolus]
MAIMGKSTRILTVYYTYQNGATRPLIRLQGKWLQELGFLPGAKIEVQENKGSLFIKARPLPEPCRRGTVGGNDADR